MKKIRYLFLLSIALLITAWGLSAQPSYSPELQPYLEFLKSQKMSAKEYILKLFENHDIVILCERAHPDVTQYELFLSIIEDSSFIKSGGNIFTEIGVSTLNPEVNSFLHTRGLSADSVDRAILNFHRNCSFYPLWEKQNFSYFLHRLYQLNQRLPSENKINLYPSDMPFDWKEMDEARLKLFWDHLDTRDSIIASQIIRKFDQIKKSSAKRKKALVIMNFRHAFNRDIVNLAGIKRSNVGRFLFERYDGRVANVYLNFVALTAVRSDNDISYSAIQDGKWDAAFKALKKEDAGFDFKGSPFGNDRFDLGPIKEQLKFEDVFTGFAYYLPLEKHKYVFGIPGIIDSSFAHELLRRYALFNTLPGQSSGYSPDIEALKKDFDVQREFQMEGLDSLNAQIDKWLH
ncbi:MAG: hypothetical protein MUP17_12855 [candidate division Zixibacteria bacterium]|nr:hypothetical protein [candidate division Zixibacteria bacterium]